jgi:hypothetical protein
VGRRRVIAPHSWRKERGRPGWLGIVILDMDNCNSKKIVELLWDRNNDSASGRFDRLAADSLLAAAVADCPGGVADER